MRPDLNTAGLHDARDGRFLLGLSRLTDALSHEGQLHDLGSLGAQVDLQWQIDTYRQSAPRFGAAASVEGLVIAGLPRTGTTALHNMLAASGRFRALTVPQALRRHRSAEAATVDEYARLRVTSLESIAPEFTAIHPVAAEGIEECTPILVSTLQCLQVPIMYQVPTYFEWLVSEADTDWVWRYWASEVRFVETLVECSRAWVLKCPLHFLNYGAMLASTEGPVVELVRDPLSWLRSLLHLILTARRVFAHPRPHPVGSEWLGLLPVLLERATCSAESAKGRIIQLPSLRLRNDPAGALNDVLRSASHPPLSQDEAPRIVSAGHLTATAHQGSSPLPLEAYGISDSQALAALEAGRRFFSYP